MQTPIDPQAETSTAHLWSPSRLSASVSLFTTAISQLIASLESLHRSRQDQLTAVASNKLNNARTILSSCANVLKALLSPSDPAFISQWGMNGACAIALISRLALLSAQLLKRLQNNAINNELNSALCSLLLRWLRWALGVIVKCDGSVALSAIQVVRKALIDTLHCLTATKQSSFNKKCGEILVRILSFYNVTNWLVTIYSFHLM